MQAVERTVVEELRALALGLPIPQPAWHPHVEAIRRVRDDLLAALDQIEADVRAVEALERLLEGAPAPDVSTAELDRIEALPVPQGEHPYLDQILPVIEAARLAQLALA